MSEDKKFIEGLFTSRRENAPSFVLASQSAKVDTFVNWLQNNANDKGYVNWDILQSDNGKVYAKHNDWKPNSQSDTNKQKFVFTNKESIDNAESVDISDMKIDEEEIDIDKVPF